MKKKCAAIILVLTMLAASLVGCGSSKSSDPAEGAAGSEIQPADSEEEVKGEDPDASSADAAEKEQITIKFWHAQTDEELQAYFDAYTETHPNVKIEQTVFMDDDYKTQARVALSGGEMPDVWYMNTSSSLDQFVGQGGLMDLSQYADAYGWNDIFDATALECMKSDGKLYGLPWSEYTPWATVYCNKDFFEENNLQYPETIDDLIALSPVIRGLGKEPLAWYNQDGWYGSIFFGEYILQMEDEDWYKKVNAGEIKWNESESAKKALEIIKKLAENDVFVTGYDTMRQDTALPLFENQQAAMAYNGTWMTQNIGPDFDFEVETIKLPVYETGAQQKAFQNYLDWCLGISPNASNLEECLEFITYAAGVQFHELNGNKTGCLTPVPSVNENVEIPYYFNTEPILYQLDKPKTPFFCYAFDTEVCNALAEQIRQITAGQITVEDALNTLQTVQETCYK